MLTATALVALARSDTRNQEQARKKNPPRTSIKSMANSPYSSDLKLRKVSESESMVGFTASEI